jgi:MinD-like ATPase involved in chromosome partitioning or flagellar assembly
MTHCIAIHSYKGGTGKTTIAANTAALLVKTGKKVALLDLDIYAPSLHNYFKIIPKKWINDFLDNNANIEETIIDVTESIHNKGESLGKFFVGFSNPNRDAIFKFEMSNGTEYWKKQFRKLVFLREQMTTKMDMDYIIIDTSPGIRHWSINALSIADKLILTMKMDDLDIEGTKKLIDEIYSTFLKFGAISYILLNRISGYCVPMTLVKSPNGKTNTTHAHHGQTDNNTMEMPNAKHVLEGLEEMKGVIYLTPLPCYCDIQFSPREFLTVVNIPNHPFSERLQIIINEIIKDIDNS